MQITSTHKRYSSIFKETTSKSPLGQITGWAGGKWRGMTKRKI